MSSPLIFYKTKTFLSGVFLAGVFQIGGVIVNNGEEAGIFVSKDVLTVAVMLVFAALVAAEKYLAYRQDERGRIRRSMVTNLQIFFANDALLGLLSVSSLLVIADKYSGFGLLSVVPSPFVKALAAFILLDLVQYWWHRARHEIPFLWQFHKVHHSDIVLNTTTAFRLHFVEVALSVAVKAVFIVVFGVSAQLVLLNETIITMFVMMSHANISFPGEKIASKVFIVPYKHAAHHSVLGSEHHKNFGFALSVWDQIFGTCIKNTPESIGLFRIREQSFWDTIFLRFKKQ